MLGDILFENFFSHNYIFTVFKKFFHDYVHIFTLIYKLHFLLGYLTLFHQYFFYFNVLMFKGSLSQPNSKIGRLFLMLCVPANICRVVGLSEATLYQITLSEVTRQTGV